jgi:hypothetical protein
MVLMYKNLSTDRLLKQFRNIRYASGDLLFGFQNNVIYDYSLRVSIIQLSLQADIFSQQMMGYRSQIDYKRMMGAYSEDWPRLLHETYIYDALKNIFYGIYSVYNPYLPDNSFSFPGNIWRRKILEKTTFQYSTNDKIPFSLQVNVNFERDFELLCGHILDSYPRLRDGLTISGNTYRYSNFACEAVLLGLHNQL